MTWLTPRRRTALLVVALAASLLATRVRRLSDWSPFASGHRAREAAERRLDQTRERAMQLELAQGWLNEARRKSLPPDPSRAATLYHAWLIEQLDACGHEDAILTPGRIGHEHAEFARLPFTMESLCTGESLSAFLDRFARSGLLHKILSLRVRPDEERSDRLRVTIDLEAIALRDAEPRESLLPEPAPDAPADRQEGRLLQAFRQDPFHLAVVQDAEPSDMTPGAEAIPETEPTGDTLLIATLHRDGVPEAWLYDRTLRTQHILHRGDHNALLGPDARLLSIYRDRIEFEKEGKCFRLDLGRSISQAVAVER